MDLLQNHRAMGPEASPLNKYELERMQRIEANRKRMGERVDRDGQPSWGGAAAHALAQLGAVGAKKTGSWHACAEATSAQ